ncbi:MAG: DUF58 domain-containing protein [Deltaproteobacteria bacterium]|nr:DUF58 domain-containing protein [Deltaproteobacteria bacterium]
MSEALIDVNASLRLRGFSFRIFPRIKGFKSGIHKSIYKGISPDFLEYKEYSRGDDLRHIDWRLYGRLDRYYVKKFEDEVSLNWWILIDTSGSMGYHSKDSTKLDYAKKLAATLAYLLIKQGDAVGIVDFSDDDIVILPPRSGNPALNVMLTRLDSLMASGKANIKEPISKAIEKTRADACFVIISDFLIDLDGIEESLKLLRSSNKETIFFHVLDRDEIEFNFDGSIEFEDMEDDVKILVDAKNIRKTYRKRVQEFVNKVKLLCHENKSMYVLSPSYSPIEEVLMQIAQK